ncbi:MAG: LamG-like jellyroll fold domain-containing protein, partial [Candidatus Thermoplasmatota archaeon]|nr:LamG-like jellyroll fold domain-containing protein [Candidatus Thermoplasmatota archaeon]
ALTTLNGELSNVDVGSTCIINSTKSLLCWGYNGFGNLGLGNTTDQYSPVAVTFPNGGTVEKVADSGGYPLHNCAIMTNGSLYCWGYNQYGQLGIGSTTQQTTPQLVNLGSGVKAVDVSVGSGFTCAVTDAGALMCWGDNAYGKLGIGSTSPSYHSTPQNASLPTNRKAVDVQLGHVHGCALLDNGDVACWGYNGFGGLGTGNTNQRTSPTVVSLDSQRQVASLGMGKHHTCIGYDNGSVVCAGRDNWGQQGTYSASNVNDLTFSYTNALANLSIIALAGEYVSCALLANGTAQCWGYGGNGQMGDGTSYDKWQPSTPVNTPSGRFIVDMSMSGQHACSVLDDGSVACWGRNNKGQLGLGNTTQQNQPVLLTGLDDLSTTSVHEMLVDPANNDFRPKWGSHLHVLNAGAYGADDADPWTAGISWNYTTPSAPVAGCMLDYADNYDTDATLSDGSCLFSSYTPPSTLDLRLHLDPTNSSSYSGSGTNVADLSGFNNNGTVAAAGPTWDADFTRFTYDGACTGTGPYICDEVNITDSTTLRPGEPYEDLAVELNTGSTTQYLTAPLSPAGYTLGAVETSFTIQAWVKPTDCENPNGAPTILSKVYSFKIGCDDGTWQYVLGNGTAWYTGWVDTGVSADNNVWQHVALTRASSSTGVKFFLNGVQSYSVSSYEG